MTVEYLIEVESILAEMAHTANRNGCSGQEWTKYVRWMEAVAELKFSIRSGEPRNITKKHK